MVRTTNDWSSGLGQLKDAVNTLITIPNDRLLSVANRTTSLRKAGSLANWCTA